MGPELLNVLDHVEELASSMLATCVWVAYDHAAFMDIVGLSEHSVKEVSDGVLVCCEDFHPDGDFRDVA